MNSFIIITPDQIRIRFQLYTDDAAQTCEAFLASLPFSRTFYHARFSGAEFWTNDNIQYALPQENASVHTQPGEIVLGPLMPQRTQTAGCLGIYYGEGKGIDCANIFGIVCAEDHDKLCSLGETIWRNGGVLLRFEKQPDNDI